MEPQEVDPAKPMRVGAASPLLDYVPLDLQRAEARVVRKAVAIAVSVLLAGVALGAGLNALDDAATGARGHAAHAAFAIAAAAAVALLAVGAAAIARARAAIAVASVILVLAALLGSAVLFDLSPLRQSIGWIRGDETIAEQAMDRFAMRLYLCWTPTVIVGIASLLLSLRRRECIGVAAALAVGLASAALWGVGPYAGRYRWLIPMKWPKLLSTGLVLLVLLLLCQLLAGAMESFRGRRFLLRTRHDGGS